MRSLEALQEAESKLSQFQRQISMLEEELRIRDEGLGAAVDGVEAMRLDRASMRDASLAALERLSIAETQLKEAVKDKNEVEYRLGEEVLLLEQQLKQASTFLDIEKSARAGIYLLISVPAPPPARGLQAVRPPSCSLLMLQHNVHEYQTPSHAQTLNPRSRLGQGHGPHESGYPGI